MININAARTRRADNAAKDVAKLNAAIPSACPLTIATTRVAGQWWRFYTNTGAGPFRFEVAAAYRDGFIAAWQSWAVAPSGWRPGVTYPPDELVTTLRELTTPDLEAFRAALIIDRDGGADPAFCNRRLDVIARVLAARGIVVDVGPR